MVMVENPPHIIGKSKRSAIVFLNIDRKTHVDIVTEDGEFETFDSSKLYYQAWIPQSPVFLIHYFHGAGAHSGEAQYLAEYMAEHGGATYACDQRGWGRSATRKAGHINNHQDVLADHEAFLQFITTQHPNLPVIMMGHSMGGLIGLHFLIEFQDAYSCAVFSSPWIGTRIPIPLYIKIFGPFLSVVWPTFSDDLQIKIDELTHDNRIITKYYQEEEDGLRKNRGTVRWFFEMQKMQTFVKEQSHLILLPTMIMQSGQDLLVSEAKSKDVYSSLHTESKSWQYYPNMYHELFNEEKREEILDTAYQFVEPYLHSIPVNPES